MYTTFFIAEVTNDRSSHPGVLIGKGALEI